MQYNDFTLSSIEKLRADWYRQGLADFDRIARVVREMGERVDYGGRVYRVFVTGNVTVHLLENEGPWDPKNNKFHTRRRITASIGEFRNQIDPRKPRTTTTAYIDASTFDPIRDQVDTDYLFFRPGQWLETVLKFEDLAIERERARAVENDNRRRDEIFTRLNLQMEV